MAIRDDGVTAKRPVGAHGVRPHELRAYAVRPYRSILHSHSGRRTQDSGLQGLIEGGDQIVPRHSLPPGSASISTSTVASRMSAPPKSILASRGSPRIIHPSSTPTTASRL